MYIGVDVGGTKTLVASLDGNGMITESIKFPTPPDYDEFLTQLAAIAANLKTKTFKAGGVGMPATVIDRHHGRGLSFGNLPWKNVPILGDLEKIFGCPMVMENDAKMAALSEAMLLKDKYDNVLYITVSTGIGIGLVVDGKIDDNVGDGGGAAMLIEYRGKHLPWESFASGHAIVDRYGKRAEDIHDQETWSKIVRDLAPGFIELIAIVQPQVIVIGGSVGTYFDRYGKLLAAELKKYDLPLVTLPKLVGAQRPEVAVIYGCYDLAKQTFKHATTTV